MFLFREVFIDDCYSVINGKIASAHNWFGEVIKVTFISNESYLNK